MKQNNNLEVPKEYWKLSDEEKEKMLNRCGPDGFINKLIPDHLLWAPIHTSCNIHDFMFVQAKSQKDLKVADEVFLRNMNKEIESSSKTVVMKTFRKILAKIYYLGVRFYSKFQSL